MCPFDELGCKYLHALAKTCKLGQNCNKRLCPNRHVEDEVDITSDNSIINDNENCSQNSGHDSSSFVTSTPQKKSFQCEECVNQSQCTDCYVRQHIETGQLPMNRKHRVNFKDNSRDTC